MGFRIIVPKIKFKMRKAPIGCYRAAFTCLGPYHDVKMDFRILVLKIKFNAQSTYCLLSCYIYLYCPWPSLINIVSPKVDRMVNLCQLRSIIRNFHRSRDPRGTTAPTTWTTHCIFSLQQLLRCINRTPGLRAIQQLRGRRTIRQMRWHLQWV